MLTLSLPSRPWRHCRSAARADDCKWAGCKNFQTARDFLQTRWPGPYLKFLFFRVLLAGMRPAPTV